MKYRYYFPASLVAVSLAVMLLQTLPLVAQSPLKQDPVDRNQKRSRVEQSTEVPKQVLNSIGTRFKLWEQSQQVLEQYSELRATPGISIEQIISYDALKKSTSNLSVHFSSESALPIFIRGDRLSENVEHGPLSDEETCYLFLEKYLKLLRIAAPRDEFLPVETVPGTDGRRHLRMRQMWKGYPVWGKEIVVHLNAHGDVYMFTGRYAPTPPPETPLVFTVTPHSAEAIAASDAVFNGVHHERNALAESLLPDERSSTQTIYAEDGKIRPAYVVELHPNLTDRWRYFIDAETGAVLRRYNASCSDGPEKAQAMDLHNVQRTIDTYLHQGAYYLIDATRPMFNQSVSTFPNNPIGAIWTVDANSTDLANLTHVTSPDNIWSDPSSVSAHYNASLTYEYFRTVHGRNSIDNDGSTIVSVVNVTQQGQAMPNAFWNGHFISYGNGGFGFEAFAKALDIAAHEMAHGVTEKTANLEYIKQSGALNESFSDIFGVMVDRDDWHIGEDITPTNTAFPMGAVRSMEDPHNGGTQGSPSWQPKHMNEYQNLPANDDNGGVHVNSGIPNHAAYLVASTLGKEQMEAIMYNALTTKLTRQSQFIDFRLAIIQAAQELFGANAAAACAQACDQVGITDGTGTGKPDDQLPIVATDKMLYYSGDPNDPFYLWTVTWPGTNPNDYTSLSKTAPISKPSITDDGNFALFVDWESNIRIINLDPANYNEQILDDSQIWSKVAISRDGNRLAVITNTNSNEIHVLDLEPATPNLRTFEVLTPNYTEQGVPNSALYADAMDFSADNQTLIYDCLNRVVIDGYQYDFWDINTMDVWDTQAGTFGSGKSKRIFTQDPRFDLSFPSFSKNSPHIFTFDVFDKFTNRAYIFAANIYEQNFNPIVEINSFTGTPNYNGDDSIISFSTVPPDGPFAGSYVVYNQAMAADKLTPVGNATIFLPDASEPVWYRQGQRPVRVERPAISFGGLNLAQNFPNPFNPVTTIEFTLQQRSHAVLTVFDRMGRKIRVLREGLLDAGVHTIHWDGRDSEGREMVSGIYFYRLLCGDMQLSRSMLLAK